MDEFIGFKIHINGIVQGVGFRPFVYNLAHQFGLTGWVKNTSAGVDIEIDGTAGAVQGFLSRLVEDAPPLSKIDQVLSNQILPSGFTSFQIIHSEEIDAAFQPISPDISTCDQCLEELLDPTDRRFRYPFINCTNCGPRFTIIEDIPYDRPKTTMSSFQLCPECAAEYLDPADRRFHAQPVACPKCGPRVWIESQGVEFDPQRDPIYEAQRLLAEGYIMAIKGLGGFHLACDAVNQAAIEELRKRKLRVDKAFAVMMPDIHTVEQYCLLEPQERIFLESPQHPIVILKRQPGCSLPISLAPGQNTLGVMLPYTPLHHLLFANQKNDYPLPLKALVMTSGNLSEEPIAIDNRDALIRLSALADVFLLHNRPIRTRCDDSVMRISHPDSQILAVRRSRGYAPAPILTPWELPPSLAAGTELKNTFCMTRGRYAFVSHHIGDMENYETYQSYEDGIGHFERLFRIKPEFLSCDLHPDYLATQYAEKRAGQDQVPLIKVQHHHAHIASCMAENNISSQQKVIGIAFDGTGFGTDRNIWGGEFLICSYHDFRRASQLRYFHLPGGDAAIRFPARIALAALWEAGVDWDPSLPPVQALSQDERNVLKSQLEQNINAPLTSSIGRLFDAASALIGLREKVNYEAQAAIEFEALADPAELGIYPFSIQTADQVDIIDPAPMFHAIVEDFHVGIHPSTIAARFHNTIVELLTQTAISIRDETSLNIVALSGGVWQNLLLLKNSIQSLRYNGFKVITHNQLPPNDGGVSFGQAIIAYHQLNGTNH